MIEKGDYVLVRGEGSEVFMVVGTDKNCLALSNGVFEPIEKCTKVPKRYENKIHSITHDYLPAEIVLEIT